MRYAIVTDIHANWQSWDVTLKDIRKRGVDSILCLGDVVGYGPSPVRVLESTYENCDGFILGNHDAVIGNRLDSDLFNDHAKQIIEWTRQQMSEQAVDLFANMSLRMEGPGFECAHAELAVPGRFGYIYQAEDSLESFSSSQSPLMFVGHTHLPGYFQCDIRRGEVKKCDPIKFQVQEGFRYLVNAGSTGDPRDGTLKSSYVIYDAVKQTVEFCYVPFDVEAYKQEVQKAAIPARNYFLQVYSGQLEETETLRDMRISTEGMAKEVRKKSVKLNSNSFKRKNVNFRKVDSRRSAQRAASSKNLEEGSRRGVKPQNNSDKKQNLILIGAGSASALMVIILLAVYFMGGDDKNDVLTQQGGVVEANNSAQEINEAKVNEKALNDVISDSKTKVEAQVDDSFEVREIPVDDLVLNKRGYKNISDFDTNKEGWLVHSPVSRRVIYRSEELKANLINTAKFRGYDLFHTKLDDSHKNSKFRVYSPAFLLDKKYLHFQKDYKGESIKLYLLKDGATNVESVLPYNEDQKAVAIMNLNNFERMRHRLLIDANNIEGSDYFQLDNLGLSNDSSSNMVRRPLSSDSGTGRDFVKSLMQEKPIDSIKDMDSLGKDLFGVNAKLLRQQLSELNDLYDESLAYLKSKDGQKIDLRLAGMAASKMLAIHSGQTGSVFTVKVDGHEYSFYPFELHPQQIVSLSDKQLNVTKLMGKYPSMHDFFNSEDFAANGLYRKFNYRVYTNEIKLSSKKLNEAVKVLVNSKSANATFKAPGQGDFEIKLPYLMSINKVDIEGLDFGKVLTLSRDSKVLWSGLGEQNSFLVTQYSSFLIGKDISAKAKWDGKSLSQNEVLNVNKSFDADTAFSLSFDQSTQSDYVRLLFWSSIGLEDDKTIYLKVRHLKDGLTNRKTTFQGVLRPYKGLNHITLSLPSEKLKSLEFDFETDDLIVIRSLKLFRTK
jgi:predicted phosphodiesterase